MELLARRAVSGGGGVPGHQGRGRLLVALYRTKRNQAKRAAARGEDVVPAKKPSKRGNNGGRPSASGKSNKKDASSKQAPVEPVEQRPSAEEIEKSWGAMRARTPLVPPPIMTVRSRKEVENTMRMKRLGLLPEDAEGEWEGYVESKNHPEMRGHRSMQRPLSSENPTSGRRTARRPVSEKAKQFINMQSAPEEVMQREFLIPDEPEFPKALDVAVIGRPNAGKSSIMNSLLDTTVWSSVGGGGGAAFDWYFACVMIGVSGVCQVQHDARPRAGYFDQEGQSDRVLRHAWPHQTQVRGCVDVVPCLETSVLI